MHVTAQISRLAGHECLREILEARAEKQAASGRAETILSQTTPWNRSCLLCFGARQGLSTHAACSCRGNLSARALHRMELQCSSLLRR